MFRARIPKLPREITPPGLNARGVSRPSNHRSRIPRGGPPPPAPRGAQFLGPSVLFQPSRDQLVPDHQPRLLAPTALQVLLVNLRQRQHWQARGGPLPPAPRGTLIPLLLCPLSTQPPEPVYGGFRILGMRITIPRSRRTTPRSGVYDSSEEAYDPSEAAYDSSAGDYDSSESAYDSSERGLRFLGRSLRCLERILRFLEERVYNYAGIVYESTEKKIIIRRKVLAIPRTAELHAAFRSTW